MDSVWMRLPLDKNRREINGIYATPIVWAYAEAIDNLPTRFIPHEFLAGVDYGWRTSRGKRPPMHEKAAIICTMKKLRRLLHGSGYDLKPVYGEGYEVVFSDSAKTAISPAQAA